MGAVIGLIIRIIGWSVMGIGVGYAASDIYNEYQDRKTAEAGASVGNVIVETAQKHWLKWVIVLGVTVVGTLLALPILKKILRSH